MAERCSFRQYSFRPEGNPDSQKFRGDFRQLAAFRAGKRDMTGDPVTTQSIDHVRESVARGIKVGRIDLLDVTAQNDLGAFPHS